MLDKIAMITFLVVYIIFLLITIFMYLVIVTDKCKTDEERKFEDEEQMNYLRNYKNGGKAK